MMRNVKFSVHASFDLEGLAQWAIFVETQWAMATMRLIISSFREMAACDHVSSQDRTSFRLRRVLPLAAYIYLVFLYI